MPCDLSRIISKASSMSVVTIDLKQAQWVSIKSETYVNHDNPPLRRFFEEFFV